MRSWRLESGSESGRWVRAGLCVRACEGGGSAWHGAHHVGHLRLCGGVDVLQRHGAVLHHEAHLGELGLRALAALGAGVGEKDVRDLATHQEGVELCAGAGLVKERRGWRVRWGGRGGEEGAGV